MSTTTILTIEAIPMEEQQPLPASTSTTINQNFDPADPDNIVQASRIADSQVPDGGYGWVIIGASAVLAFWSIGTVYTVSSPPSLELFGRRYYEGFGEVVEDDETRCSGFQAAQRSVIFGWETVRYLLFSNFQGLGRLLFKIRQTPGKPPPFHSIPIPIPPFQTQ